MKNVSFAAFHAWALARLLTALDPLSDADDRRDCGLCFGSLHGMLKHLLVGGPSSMQCTRTRRLAALITGLWTAQRR